MTLKDGHIISSYPDGNSEILFCIDFDEIQPNYLYLFKKKFGFIIKMTVFFLNLYYYIL